MYSRNFWEQAGERSLKTFAQAVIAVIGVDAVSNSVGIADVAWSSVLGVGALAAAMVYARVSVPSGSDHVVNSANFTGGANNVGAILRQGTTPILAN